MYIPSLTTLLCQQVIQLKQEKGMEEMKRLEAESALKVQSHTQYSSIHTYMHTNQAIRL
jgi:hypothetical protein